MVGKVVVIVIAVAAVLGALLVLTYVPYPGHYNADITVTAVELSVIVATDFEITGVSASQAGQSSILQWNALSFTGFQVEGQFELTATLSNGLSSSLSSNQWFPSVPFVNGATVTATNTIEISYVPTGTYDVSVVLYDNGDSVATGTTSLTVGS